MNGMTDGKDANFSAWKLGSFTFGVNLLDCMVLGYDSLRK